MRARRGAITVAVAGAALTILVGGADATAEPAPDRACADTSSFTATAAPVSGATQLSFRVVRCGS